MTVFDAERLIRDFWQSPPRSPLAYAARLVRILDDLRDGLTEASARELCRRLGASRRRCNGSDAPMSVLQKVIDRREECGIEAPERNAEQRYGHRVHVTKSRTKNHAEAV